MNIKEKLTCKYCNQLYKEPITLTCCGDNLCKQHIAELISNSSSSEFWCPLCNEQNSNKNFKVSKIIQELIEIEAHNFELDPKYERILNGLKTEIGNLENISHDPENYIYDEINELKRQVDLDRERLKTGIDDLADGLIQKLESYQIKFKAEFKAKNIELEEYKSLVESSKKSLIEYERCLNLFLVVNLERDKQSEQCQDLIKTLQS